MITVKFMAVHQRRQWQQACILPVDQTAWLCVGFVRYSVGGGCWIARPRAIRQDQPPSVRLFAERADAAAWLLIQGGFAQPRSAPVPSIEVGIAA